MKKLLLILVAGTVSLALALALLAPTLLGFSITQLGNAVSVATGMGAKLACSGRFVSGFTPGQNLDDLASYSPANRLLDLHYDEQNRRVTASLLGMGTTSASFRPGLGCTLDIGDTRKLDHIQVTALPKADGEWPQGNRASHIDPTLQQTLDALLTDDNLAGQQTRALLVVQDGQLVAESYGDGIDAETPLLGWSMGKSVTAMMIGRLEQLERLPATPAPLFDAWKNDARAEITLDDMLHMSSGLDFDETYAPGSDATRMLFNSHSASDVALASQPRFAPGEHFSYSSGTTNLLARWVTEQLGGSPQAAIDFFQKELVRPLGMQHTVFEPDPSGIFVGSSYIYASARDWARLGQLMLDNGQWQGRQLLSPEWVARARTPNESENDPNYGYQFWLNSGGDARRFPQLPEDAYFMLGNRKQVVMISPSTNTVIVRLGWSAQSYPTGENFARLMPASAISRGVSAAQ